MRYVLSEQTDWRKAFEENPAPGGEWLFLHNLKDTVYAAMRFSVRGRFNPFIIKRDGEDISVTADFVASGVDAFDGRFFVINMRNGKSVVNTGVNPRPAEFCHSQWIGNMTGGSLPVHVALYR